MVSQIVEKTTKLPSFLATMLINDGIIKLAYLPESPRALVSKINSTLEEDTEDAFELTGTPLETDLDNKDDLPPIIICEKPKSWTVEEATYLPISLTRSRKYLQLALNANLSKPIFCISDGKEQNIVLNGAWKSKTEFTRTLLYILPCYNEHDIQISLSNLEKEHLKLIRNETKPHVEYCYKQHLFYADGYSLKNCVDLQESKIKGSTSMTVLRDSIIATSLATATMNFEVIVGHPNSAVHHFWLELATIYRLEAILKSCDESKGATILNNCSNESAYDIKIKIDELVSKQTHGREKIIALSLDLDNLRPLSILDDLWLILKNCHNLEDLRESFTNFFEAITEINSPIDFFSTEKLSFIDIASALVDGKIIIPNINLAHCLKFLIELGVQKLKHDYFAIITTFAQQMSLIDKKWRDLSDEEDGAALKKANAKVLRKTLDSLQKENMESKELVVSKKKMSFLLQLHTVVEFVFFNKTTLQDNYNFDTFCNLVLDKFLMTSRPMDFGVRLCELSMPANFNEMSKKFCLSSWTLKMSYKSKVEQIISSYHFSLDPIIPPSIFNDYEVPKSDNIMEKTFYSTKLNQFTAFI